MIIRLVACCLLLALPSFADKEIPVELKADKIKFYDNSNLVEATGSVEVVFKDVTIRADSLVMDSVTNVATAEGNISLLAGGYRATASRMTYDSDRDASSFLDFKSTASPKNLKGNLYFTARQMEDDKDVMKGGPGEVSTCDNSNPHYDLRASKVEYYPNDRIIGYNAVSYVGELPVFWTPYFIYDFKNQRKRNWVFGHNEVEGDFLKTAWDFPCGLLLLDYMQKKGIGYGTELPYGLAAVGAGKLYLYHIREKDTGLEDWVVKLNGEKQLTPFTKLNYYQRYVATYLIPSGRMDQTALGFNLNYNNNALWNLKVDALDDRAGQYEKYALQFNESIGKTSLNYAYNYDFGKSDPRWMNKNQRFYLKTPLSDSANFDTTTTYYHGAKYAGDAGSEKVEPQVNLTGSTSQYTWRYSENWFIDLRPDPIFAGPRYEFLEKQPEIEISPRPLDLKLFTLNSTLGYGYYREAKYVSALGKIRDFATQRYRTTVDASQNFPLGLGTVLSVGLGLDQFLYGPGDQFFNYRERGGLQTNLFSFLRNDLAYRKGYTDGNTPFLFDKLGTSYHDAQERLTFYHLNKFSWSFDGGYNWQTHKWFDAMTHLQASPGDKLKGAVDTGWDIENTKYKDLVYRLSLIPYSFFSMELSGIQDMNIGETKSGTLLYDIFFLEKQPNQMHLRFNQVYDPQSREFRVRDIMIIKDLHCWEMKFTYSDYYKGFSFVFNLKALPGEPVGFESTRGFYYDGFERGMRAIQPETEVRRY